MAMSDFFSGVKNLTVGEKGDGGFLGWLKGKDNAGTSNALSLLGVGGAFYDAYKRNKFAKQQLNMQKQAFDFNKMLSQRQLNMQKEAQQNLNNAWNNSTFMRKEDEENAL